MVPPAVLLLLWITSLFAMHFPSGKGSFELSLHSKSPQKVTVEFPQSSNTLAGHKTTSLYDTVIGIEGLGDTILSGMDKEMAEHELLDILLNIELLDRKSNRILTKEDQSYQRGLSQDEQKGLRRLHDRKALLDQLLKKEYASSSNTLMRYPLYRKYVCTFPVYFETMSEIPHSLALMKIFPKVYSWRGMSKLVYPLALTAGIVQKDDVSTAFREKVNAVVSNAKVILRLLVKASGFLFSVNRESMFNAWSALFKSFYGFFNDIGLIYSSFWSSILKLLSHGFSLTEQFYFESKLDDATFRLFDVGVDVHRPITGFNTGNDLSGNQYGSFLEINIRQIESQLETHARIFDYVSSIQISQDHLAYVSATREIIANIRGMSEDVKQLLSDNFPNSPYNPKSPSMSILLDNMAIKSLKFTPIIDTVLNEKSSLLPLLMAFETNERVHDFLPFFIKYSDPSFDPDFPELFNVERKDGRANIEDFNNELKNLPSTVWKHPYSVLFSMLDPSLPLNAVLEAGSVFSRTIEEEDNIPINERNHYHHYSMNMIPVQLYSMKKLEQINPLLKAHIYPHDVLNEEIASLSDSPEKLMEAIYSQNGKAAKTAFHFLRKIFEREMWTEILNHWSYIRMRLYSVNEYHNEYHNDFVSMFFLEHQFVDNPYIAEIHGIRIMQRVFNHNTHYTYHEMFRGIVYYFFLKNLWEALLQRHSDRNR